MLKQYLVFLAILTITFAVHQQAENCQADKNQFFDQINKECRKCPPGSPKYNSQSKMCQCCPNNMVWNLAYKQCICPANNPVHNDKLHICLSCPNGLEYDAKQNQCFHCPEGFKKGPQSSCVPMYI